MASKKPPYLKSEEPMASQNPHFLKSKKPLASKNLPFLPPIANLKKPCSDSRESRLINSANFFPSLLIADVILRHFAEEKLE